MSPTDRPAGEAVSEQRADRPMSPGALGILHLVPTLLDDQAGTEGLPASTLAVARRCSHFLVEAAKPARAFLKTIAHPLPIQSLHIEEIGHAPDPARIDQWLAPLRAPGAEAALLSEAGCPGVADPGATLVARAHELGITVNPCVGPSAILLALMASGMNGQSFAFVGYLPQDAAACASAIRQAERASATGQTQLFIETPYRSDRLFAALLEVCQPDTHLALAADLTSNHQLTATRTVAHWRAMPAARRPQLNKRPCVFALLAPPRPARRPSS